jgi:hypothetical protein
VHCDSPATRRRDDRRRALVVVVVFLLAAWLDRDNCVVAQHASIFSAIWAGLQWLGNILGIVGGAVATSLEAVVGYLVTAVSWLTTRVANILVSTGAIFAKAWDALKIVWSDVLKPALVWIDKTIARVQAWLKDTLGPVFRWLDRIRVELNAIYNRFVKPLIDTIEFVRQVNRVLLTFHITWLQKLDNYLAELERRIREPILWLYARLSEVQNAVNFILTADGFFQRYALLRSMDRYAPAWMRSFWDKQVVGLSGQALDDARALKQPLTAPASYGAQLGKLYSGADSEFTGYVGELVPLWKQAAGVSAPLT